MSLPVLISGYSEDEELYASGDDLRSASAGTGRANSPTPSVYSYSSSVDGRAMLRDLHGRTLQSTSEAYMLPADTVEHSRLDLQHEMFRKKLGGLFLKPEAVRRALAPKQDMRPAVIDIGTGSGSWAIDMGRLFPHAEVVGMDLAPANLSATPPPNCRFECDDANLGLDHYANSFNVVHSRLICIGITNYRALLADIGRMLRPGGIYLSIEADLQLFDENFEAITAQNEGEPGFTWLQKVAHASHAAFKERAPGGIDAGYMIPKWLQSMDCWEETGSKKVYFAVGAWEDDMDERQRYVADLMSEDARTLCKSLRPLLLSYGYFPETVDKWVANADDEIRNVKAKQYIRFHCAWAIKRRD
ncbi:hypothetical protein FRB95_005234 [Tulasnella sp. JGI-2019a]|nr:hypothetical protein FRB95_005234 [Tulasnella sp. JGI-2019a]